MLKFQALEQLTSYTENDKDNKQNRRQQTSNTHSPSHVTNTSTEAEKLKGAAQDLFELVARAQSSRLDDQRCSLPAYFAVNQTSRDANKSSPPPPNPSPTAPHGSQRLLEAALLGPGPYPSLVLPSGGGYWREEVSNSPAATPELELDETASCYRQYFMGKEHCNLVSDCGLLSLRTERTEGGEPVTRVLLRLRSGSVHKIINTEHQHCTPAQLARIASSEVGDNAQFSPVLCPGAADLIAAYDEHAVARAFKFGVLQQRRGQTTEEQIFSNREPSPALLDFLPMLGHFVKLRDHKGYRGGLDTQYGQTGEDAVYRVYRGREIMYHVAGLLPFADSDPQQLQRKRHIGNDIVAIVFQEENTPFAPDMIASHFLHVFIVVQPVQPCTPHVRYRIHVAARDGVPKFGPALPSNGEFRPGPELQEWLLTKLINAEMAACKASTFASLECRTRAALLSSLTEELRTRTSRFLGESSSPEQSGREQGAGSRFISTVRKAITARAQKTQTAEPPGGNIKNKSPAPSLPSESSPASVRLHCEVSRRSSNDSGSSERGGNSGASSPELPTHRPVRPTTCESDASSVGSGGGPYAGDSDTGLESMSSAEREAVPCCSPASNNRAHTQQQLETLTQEVARLKCDKLDLLRHNVICQRDVKLLTEQTLQLRTELASASSELRRLRALLRECAFSSDASDV